jgi:hypothetical protein
MQNALRVERLNQIDAEYLDGTDRIQVVESGFEGGVRDYAFNELSKNTSEFAGAEGGCSKTVFAISKNREPPTTFFNG